MLLFWCWQIDSLSSEIKSVEKCVHLVGPAAVRDKLVFGCDHFIEAICQPPASVEYRYKTNTMAVKNYCI